MAIYCCALTEEVLVLDHIQKLELLRSGPFSRSQCMRPLDVLPKVFSKVSAVRFMTFKCPNCWAFSIQIFFMCTTYE
jgi:hypothetical protein